MTPQPPDEYERMKSAISLGNRVGLSPLRAVANMRPALKDSGLLLRRWLDEQRGGERV